MSRTSVPSGQHYLGRAACIRAHRAQLVDRARQFPANSLRALVFWWVAHASEAPLGGAVLLILRHERMTMRMILAETFQHSSGTLPTLDEGGYGGWAECEQRSSETDDSKDRWSGVLHRIGRRGALQWQQRVARTSFCRRRRDQ